MITTAHRPIDYGKQFLKFKKHFVLSYNEQVFLAELKKVNSDSVWGWAIHDVLTNYSIEKFRQLVCELLSQQADDFITLERVLGTKASVALLKLRPCHI